MSMSLREGWASAPFPYGSTPRWRKIRGRYRGPPPSELQLRPLSEGIRASSRAYTVVSGGRRSFVVPFSLRTMLANFVRPRGYDVRVVQGEVDPPDGPSGGWTKEVQGIAFSATTTYLTTTEAVWCVSVVADGEAEGRATAPAEGPLSVRDSALVARLGTEPPRATISVIWRDGLLYFGRKYAAEGRTGMPVHVSPPFFAFDRLIVPAEGDRRYPNDPFWDSTNPSEHSAWERNRALQADVRYQTLYVVDPLGLGYLGRIGLPAKDVPMGLGDYLAACAFDRRSNLLLTTVAASLAENAPVRELYLYRLPDLKAFPTVGSVFSITETPELHQAYPTAFAEYVGALPLADEFGWPIALFDVNGIAISDDGHLFVDHAGISKSAGDTGIEDKGIARFDIVTGRQIGYISMGGIDGRLQGMTWHGGQVFVVSGTGVHSEGGYLVSAVSEGY